MEGLLQRQQIIAEAIQKITTNVKKDSASRKTTEYIAKRLESLQQLWQEFEGNNEALIEGLKGDHDYFGSTVYHHVKDLYEVSCEILQKTSTASTTPKPGTSGSQAEGGRSNIALEEKGMLSRSDELISQQRTNFRALSRIIRGIDFENICDKWEIEDCLKTLHKRWKLIDELHWQIDNLLVGTDVDYEEDYSENEVAYVSTKRRLNQKLSYTCHQYQTVSQLEIPTFSGIYTQWPTFKDLYSEAIHKNPQLSKTQKMQHLKGKLRGEAERIVQHLNIAAENYDACWDILTHRYNNQQLLFTKQMQIFMNQPTMTRHSAYELKRLHDTSLESVHAISNLKVDTSTWDPILVHIVTEKMDPETYTSYMENRRNARELPSFRELTSFLENKFTALEPINQKKAFNPPKQDQGHSKAPQWKPIQDKSFPRRTYLATEERKCPLCNSNHILIYCKMFQGLSSEEKMNKLQRLNICKNCLYCHDAKPCNSTKRCRVCEKAHHTSLHDMFTGNKLAYKGTMPMTQTHRASNHVTGNVDEILLATVEINVRSNDGTYLKLRALLDQGSQINLITESAAQQLGLHRRKQNAKISGIGISANKINGVVQLTCESMSGDYTINTEAMVMSKMLNNLPNYTFEKPQWPHLQNIILADKDFNISRHVDILLDAAVYAEIVMEGIVRGPATAPVAQQTRLGWVLMGNVKTFNCHVVLNNLEEISQFWESEEIADNEHDMTSSQDYCETLYKTTTKRGPDGRYEIRLPMKPHFEELLGSSRPQAMAQFSQLEKRLAKDDLLAGSYTQFMIEYLQLGHMKECTSPQAPSCYLPHHGVIKPDSQTTKLRVVLNASQRTSSGHSLNDLMEGGPNLQRNIQALILQWRFYKYVYTADIEKFYRQIRVQEQDQHLQKVIWRDPQDNTVRDYQLMTVTYGTKAAPYLAMRTIKQLAKDDGGQYPNAAEILNNQLYVDDLLGGHNSLEEAKHTQKQLLDLLHGGGFNLRKWASNDVRLLDDLAPEQISQNMLDFKHAETNKTLGITWNPCTDNFTFQHRVQGHTDNNIITKRTLLSDLSKLYDPVGWISPVTVKAKIIFQQLWATELTWDDPLPEHIQNEWHAFKNEIHMLQDITIPRWIGNTGKPVQLNGFSDASERAISCAIYCRSIDDNGEYIVRLVAAKTKLSPLKKPTTLPRLELCGALLLARLMKKVIESQKIDAVSIHGWTDSTVVLGWLKGNISRWKTFVANRVRDILAVMPVECWKHVKSEDNPADCASRGLNPSQLINHELWWHGPEWLKMEKPPTESKETISYEVPKQETKQKKQVNIVQAPSLFMEEHLHKHSSMTKAVRVLGWISRFIHNCLNKSTTITAAYLTTSELEKAQLALIKAVQSTYFVEEINRLQTNRNLPAKSKILNLNPYLDDKNILRVGGRLGRSDLTAERKHPIILPHNSRLTYLIINQAHMNTLHGGVRLTLTHLRNKYWILRGVNTVKGHILKCVTCHRFKPTTSNQLMAELPRPRVTPSRPFTHTGVDFTGHVEVKANKGRGIKTMKAYISIFVCLATKAVHIELVTDLSTDAFLAALKRFCARRAKPQVMYSDNGRNFIGAAKVLKKEHNEALQYYINNDVISEMAQQGIEWKFNAPSWPTAGGLWEGAVKSMKHHLKRVLGEQKLTYEEFSTLLTQIEACMNSRPLTSLTNELDLNSLDCLTPGHFLVGGPVLAGPLTPVEETRNIRTRWQLTERMHKDFWKRWSSDYLHTLQTRAKWWHPKKNLETGDLVLIKEDNMPPASWLMGRVIDTHEGSDGLVRVVSLKTKNNIVKRPVTKLSRLPIDREEDNTEQTDGETNEPDTDSEEEIKTRNRKKKKHGASYLLTLICLLLCVSPSVQQLFKTSNINPNKLIYFDKLADMKVVQDNWKMVVYYNMTTYWRNLRTVQIYVAYLADFTKNEPTFSSLTSQFKHEIDEIKHYNDMLRVEHGRRSKRGLIDGIGYVQNYLFGVLDGHFAEQYVKDITSLKNNQNHLQHLYKKQTSIIEGEYNLLKRNEKVMNNQFVMIDRQLQEVGERIKLDRETTLNMMSSALTANIIISNLRRVQQSLLDLVTDVRNGRVDAHLLKPDQFQDQLNIISGQISSELSLPCVNSHHCVREMYMLSRVQLRLTPDYMIFEVKLPLVNNEPYELSRMIPIPQIKGQGTEEVITGSEFIAVNLKKDLMMPLTYEDIATCTALTEHQLLCTLDKPLYDTKVAETRCEAQIINNRNLSACRLRLSDCNDHWIQLQHSGAWLYTCCRECLARIFCTYGVTSATLNGTGIIELAPGCELKGNEVIIHAHHLFKSKITVTDEETHTYKDESIINKVINAHNYTFIPNEHHRLLEGLHAKIEKAKEDQDSIVDLQQSHDAHRYVTYCVIILLTAAATAWAIVKTRRLCHHQPAQFTIESITTRDERRSTDEPHARPREHIEMSTLDLDPRPRSVDRATSPRSDRR